MQHVFKIIKNVSAFHTTRETKLQSFQYRILHRTITCRKKLYDMKLVDSPIVYIAILLMT